MSDLELRISCEGDQGFSLALDCELPGTGVTAIYGPSGSGKSTLLDCIAGLRKSSSGSLIRCDGETWQDDSHFTPPWQRPVAYVFQDGRLFPHLSVQQNLEYGLRRRQRDSTVGLEQVTRWLELSQLLERSPDTLSAGQKQRVAIGRALLCAPRLLLLDEPLANLDHTASQQCMQYLQRLEHELSLPMLYVSHDIEEVSQMADHLVLLEQGRMLEQGSLLELCGRLDTRLSQEEQAAAIVVGNIARHDADYGLTELEVEGQLLYVSQQNGAPGQQRRLRIPARDISVCRQRPDQTSILNVFPVTLEQIEESGGARVLLRLALGSQHLLARITRKSATELRLQPGDSLFAQIKSAALLMEAVDHHE